MHVIMLAFACRQQYHALRAAAAAGYKVHVLGRDCAEGLKYSRYCASYHVLNFDACTQPVDVALAEINHWITRLSAQFILPSDIVSTRLLASLAKRLPIPTCALPDPACFDRMNDKWQFYHFCMDNGVRVPQTWLFDAVAPLKKAVADGVIPFPFIVKPHDSMGKMGIFRVKDESGLKKLDKIDYAPLLVQKLIKGPDIDISIVANKGRIGAYAIQRNFPEKYVFIRHDRLLEQAARFAESSGFHGIAHLDAIEEKGTGDIYLIECNPRVWYSIFAAVIAGLNFVQLSLEMDSLDPKNPKTIIGKVHGGKVTGRLTRQLLTRFRLNKMDYRLLKYNFADLIGKRVSRLPRFDDSLLAPSSTGSVARQITALAVMRKQGGLS